MTTSALRSRMGIQLSMGSAAVAGLIAQAVFWGLLLLGIAFGEMSRKRIAVFVCLWLGAWVSFRWLPDWLPFSSYVAILDIALVFQLFKGDVKLL